MRRLAAAAAVLVIALWARADGAGAAAEPGAVVASGASANPGPGSAPDAPAGLQEARPAMRGDAGTFLLRDGRTLDGVLVTTSDHGDVIQLKSGERVFLPGHSVVSVRSPRPERPARDEALAPGEVRAFLRDGSVVEGRLVGRDDDALHVETAGREQLDLRADQVRAAWTRAGRVPRMRGVADAARVRALWSPTAFLLDPGEVALGAELLDLSLSAGVHDVVMIAAESTLPWGYASGFDRNATFTAKGGVEAFQWLHVGGGAQAYVSSKGRLVSLFGVATFGSENRFLSLFVGPPPTGAETLGRFGDRIVSAAAAWRVLPRIALLAEGWLGAQEGAGDALGAAGLRFVGRRFAVDGGALYAPASGFVPFLSVTVTVLAP